MADTTPTSTDHLCAGVAQRRADGISVRVRAKPRASRSALAGVQDHGNGPSLTVAIAAPPVDGAANTALGKTIAAALGVRAGAVAIASGETGRTKLVLVTGDPDVLIARLAEIISAFPDKR